MAERMGWLAASETITYISIGSAMARTRHGWQVHTS